MNKASENKRSKSKFSWDKFNPEKFFAETDKIARIFYEERKKDKDTEKIEYSHEG